MNPTRRRPHFLLTNDDGIDAPGLAVLERVARRHGEVTLVAPRWEMSATSHAITLHTPLRLMPCGVDRYALHEGTPVDCVYVGVQHLCPEPPTMVLSGVNMGLNIGHDVIYSGTVAAARQAFLMGVTGLAFSYATGGGDPVDAAEAWVEAVLERALVGTAGAVELLNVNVPNPAVAPITGVAITRLGHRVFSSDIERRLDPRGREYLWIGGGRVEEREVPDSDCEAIRSGRVSITPLGVDTTALQRTEAVRRWAGGIRPAAVST